jgi:hypothetical protein
MEPTLFMAWLSHSADGGWFDPAERKTGEARAWRKHGPLHLSLHTSREAAWAALREAVLAEWDRSTLTNVAGPVEALRDPVSYAGRFLGYDAHVTEQPVTLP